MLKLKTIKVTILTSIEKDTQLLVTCFMSMTRKRATVKEIYLYNVCFVAEPAVIAKSSLLLDVKPWDDETGIT